LSLRGWSLASASSALRQVCTGRRLGFCMSSSSSVLRPGTQPHALSFGKRGTGAGFPDFRACAAHPPAMRIAGDGVLSGTSMSTRCWARPPQGEDQVARRGCGVSRPAAIRDASSDGVRDRRWGGVAAGRRSPRRVESSATRRGCCWARPPTMRGVSGDGVRGACCCLVNALPWPLRLGEATAERGAGWEACSTMR